MQRRKPGDGLLIGSFAKEDEAGEAARMLKRRGFRRAALLSRSAEGTVRVGDRFLRSRRISAAAAAVILGLLSSAAALLLGWPPLETGAAGAFAGLLLGWTSRRRSRGGVDAMMLKDLVRWLVPGETILVIQAPIATLHTAITGLRDGSDIPPAVFILHEKTEAPPGDLRSFEVPLSPAQIQEHAESLGMGHGIESRPRKNARLIARLNQAHRWIHDVCAELSQAGRLEQGTPPTAEWILDNEYVIDSNVRDVIVNLPVHYYRRLPTLVGGRYPGLPRIYDLARELLADLELRLDRESVLAYLDAYQSAGPLSIGELWALPQMLRIALIESISGLALRAAAELRERESADFWANRLFRASSRGPDHLFSLLAELAGEVPAPSPYFASQLVNQLYDEESVLVLVQAWLERTSHLPLGELSLREQNRQAKEQMSIGNAFTSLRQLALLDWREIFERSSRVERLLHGDPSGVYPHMDFETRDRCRRVIEHLSRASGLAEVEVAENALSLAREASRALPAGDERTSFVGTYLVGEGRAALVHLLGCDETRRFRFLRWVYRRSSAVFFFSFGVMTAGVVIVVGLAARGAVTTEIQLLVPLLLLPGSQLALEVLNYLATRLLPPRALPKMDFKKTGVPDKFRTLVVVPVLLGDTRSIRTEVEKLEVRYLANREDNLLFSLFTDFQDADEEHTEDDARLLREAVEDIESLNSRHGVGRFFLFHRDRSWSESERKFIGWERKRGKLEELNGLLAGTRPPDAPNIVHVGRVDGLDNVRFVITLDSDTQLPLGSARRMIETLAHPLNQPRFDTAGAVLPGGFTIIQPRVIPSLSSSSASAFSRLFADAVGIDPYARVISDVHQDLKGEGSYYGKGIYDVRAFDRVLGRRFPDARLLSHDLIEGAHVRVGLASDIELYDEFPKGYGGYADRQHRWIRGDWQIAQWISSRVPPRLGKRPVRNPLSMYDRWKLLDNLRRSLVPAANVGLIAASWAISPRAGWMAGLLVAAQLLFRPLAQPFTMMTSRRGIKGFSLASIVHDVLRALVDAAMLPHQAALSLDAILRAAWRRHISHRGLLQWNSTQVVGTGPGRRPALLLTMAAVSGASAVLAFALWRWMPASLPAAAPWLAAWLLSPLVAWRLNLVPRDTPRRTVLPTPDTRFLREIARRTWRYFDDFVNVDTSWLPPDNYQVSPRNELALRTSPTNIGLWMLSALAARDFGYVTVDQVVQRLAGTMETIGGLERFEGHLLNWYDVRTRAPLEPRYVSTVDSGNLLGSLWTLEQGLVELLAQPVLDRRAFTGLRDAGRILRRIRGRGLVPSAGSRALALLMKDWESPSYRLVDMLALLRAGSGKIGTLSDPARPEEDYWIGQIGKQLDAWMSIADRYLAWMEILAEKSGEQVAALDARLLEAVKKDGSRVPSLIDLAGGRVECIAILQEVRDTAPPPAGPMLSWLDRLLEAFSKSRWLAGEVLARGEGLIRDCAALSEQINMRFLYDPLRRLFTIGYSVSEGRRDSAFYDLLASEARLGSFLAIARGDVPFDHWFSLSRPYTALGRRRVLLSWTGTMFEYLMPLLFQGSPANTLLGEAARGAIAAQMDYGRRQRVPWGISESAFADMDLNKIYQYRAFGVPELGLKREPDAKVVIAPYAAMLALGMAPRETVRNLRRLAGVGLLDAYGYYESIDFSRQHGGRIGDRGVVVQAYMAHHQGMGFLSLANFLLHGAVRRRFRADPRVRAVESLLHERIPVLPSSHHISTRERTQSVQSVGGIAPSTSIFDTALTRTPKTQLLSNGRYSLMITNAGGGYSQWGAEEITRWRSDPTRDPWGTLFYIHEPDSGTLWSPTSLPVGGSGESYSVTFALDRAVFQRVDSGIHSRMEVVVSPEDDVEIRRVTLTNRSLHTRRLECSSYVELAMAPHAADRQHPAFNKLFIQTEAVPQQNALIAFRRPRGNEAAPRMYVAHRLTPEGGRDETFRFETDRRRFVGRGHSLSNPLGAVEEPRNGAGNVLDPILSLRTSLSLAPGHHVTISLVLAAGDTREQVLGLMGKYAAPQAINRALDFAWAAAQLELRVLRIQPDDARRFQQLASHLLYPNRLLRAPLERLRENMQGQDGLWRYGISGDLPIALVTIGESRDIGLVGQMLQAHAYWRMHGLMADLVILAEESGDYERPLHERLEGLIRAHSTNTGRDRPGGVFLRSADQIPEADQTLLLAAASIVFVSARGPLPQQVGIPGEPRDDTDAAAWKGGPHYVSPPLPFLELPYFNGLGGFTPDGREYAIYLGDGTDTPAPWVNVIANPGFGTLVSERGSGFTWSGNSQRNRLTAWSNDPVVDPGSEALFIRDEETGRRWTPTASPIREGTAYRARHGAGYSVFEHNSNGINQELVVFVPMEKEGGQPVKLEVLRLENTSARSRLLSVTWYVEWVLGEHRETSQMHIVTAWDGDMQAITARNRFHPDYGGRVAFAAVTPPADSWSGDRTRFLGRNGSLETAAAMDHLALSGQTGAGLDPCAALRVTVRVAPGERTTITCMLGQAETLEAARAIVTSFRAPGAVESALAGTRAWWDRLLGAIKVHTPELAADFLVNRWLLYQSLSCRIWGRSASYQSGGAFGFRDQLQDVMALLYAEPRAAREQIVLAASRQFREGDVQHWWHPPGGAGIRSRISDDLLWLPYVVAQYVRISGDASILDTVIPFLDGPPLRDDQHEAFFTPTVADERASLFEHCRRAVARGLTKGSHGVPLIGTGDWNDGLNLVGAAGKGESVWLGWFLVDVLCGMSELSRLQGLADSCTEYLRLRDELVGRMERAAWDGEWYLRAFFDDGTPLGSSTNEEMKIDSLPQSWAVLSGGGDPARSRTALESAWTHLVREQDGLVLIFEPPFDKAVPAAGYVQGYPPGVRENGGQYTHAALWLAMAMARSGDGTRAARLLRMLNPVEQARDPESVTRYAVEPYAASADVYNLPGHVGQGGWSWYTGSAAWMYRAWVEEVLGLKLRGERLTLDPVIPAWWGGFSLTYRHGEAVYEIQVKNPEGCERGVAWIEQDGQRVADGVIQLERGAVSHLVILQMGKS